MACAKQPACLDVVDVEKNHLAFARITPQAFRNNLFTVLEHLVNILRATEQVLESDAVVVEAIQFLQSLQQGKEPTEPS